MTKATEVHRLQNEIGSIKHDLKRKAQEANTFENLMLLAEQDFEIEQKKFKELQKNADALCQLCPHKESKAYDDNLLDSLSEQPQDEMLEEDFRPSFEETQAISSQPRHSSEKEEIDYVDGETQTTDFDPHHIVEMSQEIPYMDAHQQFHLQFEQDRSPRDKQGSSTGCTLPDSIPTQHDTNGPQSMPNYAEVVVSEIQRQQAQISPQSRSSQTIIVGLEAIRELTSPIGDTRRLFPPTPTDISDIATVAGRNKFGSVGIAVTRPEQITGSAPKSILKKGANIGEKRLPCDAGLETNERSTTKKRKRRLEVNELGPTLGPTMSPGVSARAKMAGRTKKAPKAKLAGTLLSPFPRLLST